MNITNLLHATSLNTVAVGAKNALSLSIGKWSGIILGTSLMGLAAYGTYHWNKERHAKQVVKNPDLDKVKARVSSVYQYVIGSLAVITVTGALAHAAGLSRHILMNSFYCVPVVGITTIGSLIATALIKKEDTNAKHIALAIFTGSFGLMFSTLGYLPGQVIAQAAAVTMVFGGAMTFFVHQAPNKDFLKWEGPLLTALTTISIASFVTSFFPTTAFAYGIDRVSLYGGLLICSGLFMASTQRLINEANTQSDSEFNPINSSLSIIIDAVNIFLRFARIINENQNKQENLV